jgi:hypothetical protein
MNTLPAPVLPRRVAIVACAALLAIPFGLSACGNSDEEQGVDEPAREGLALPLDGVNYNVFLTRELNPKIQEDEAYVSEDAPAGSALYGIFIQACNKSKDPRTPTDRFMVKDNQGNTFEPKALPADNQFGYRPRTLDPQECIPEAGSVAQLGPTAGAMLLFEFPLEITENRPLELEIEGQGGDKLTYELDL